MGLPSCRRCGASDPHRMIGLMTLWFGPFADLEPAHGYFHLCPRCNEALIDPHLHEVQQKLAQLHPAVAAYLERERELDAGREPEEAESPESS